MAVVTLEDIKAVKSTSYLDKEIEAFDTPLFLLFNKLVSEVNVLKVCAEGNDEEGRVVLATCGNVAKVIVELGIVYVKDVRLYLCGDLGKRKVILGVLVA